MNTRAVGQSSSQSLYPTAALVGYKITLFEAKSKRFFEKSSGNRTKIRYFVTTHKIDRIFSAKLIKQAPLGPGTSAKTRG